VNERQSLQSSLLQPLDQHNAQAMHHSSKSLQSWLPVLMPLSQLKQYDCQPEFVGTWIFKKEAMGGGDLKMMAMLGAFLGWSSIWLIIFVGSLVGTLVAIGPLVMGKKKLSDEIPFGPFLAVGAFVVLCWKDIIYQGLFFR
jgi:hypothetical protein